MTRKAGRRAPVGGLMYFLFMALIGGHLAPAVPAATALASGGAGGLVKYRLTVNDAKGCSASVKVEAGLKPDGPRREGLELQVGQNLKLLTDVKAKTLELERKAEVLKQLSRAGGGQFSIEHVEPRPPSREEQAAVFQGEGGLQPFSDDKSGGGWATSEPVGTMERVAALLEPARRTGGPGFPWLEARLESPANREPKEGEPREWSDDAAEKVKRISLLREDSDKLMRLAEQAVQRMHEAFEGDRGHAEVGAEGGGGGGGGEEGSGMTWVSSHHHHHHHEQHHQEQHHQHHYQEGRVTAGDEGGKASAVGEHGHHDHHHVHHDHHHHHQQEQIADGGGEGGDGVNHDQHHQHHEQHHQEQQQQQEQEQQRGDAGAASDRHVGETRGEEGQGVKGPSQHSPAAATCGGTGTGVISAGPGVVLSGQVEPEEIPASFWGTKSDEAESGRQQPKQKLGKEKGGDARHPIKREETHKVTPNGEQVAKRIEVEGGVGSGMRDAKETESSSPVGRHAVGAGVEGASMKSAHGRDGGAQLRGDGDAKEASRRAGAAPSPGGVLPQGQDARGWTEIGAVRAGDAAIGGGVAGGSGVRASALGEAGSHSTQPKEAEEWLQELSSEVKPQTGQSSESHTNLVHGVVGGQSLHGEHSPGRGIGGHGVVGVQAHQGEGRRLGGGVQSGARHAQQEPVGHWGSGGGSVSHGAPDDSTRQRSPPDDSTRQRSPAYPVPPALEEYVSRRQPAAKSRPAAMVSCGASPSSEKRKDVPVMMRRAISSPGMKGSPRGESMTVGGRTMAAGQSRAGSPANEMVSSGVASPSGSLSGRAGTPPPDGMRSPNGRVLLKDLPRVPQGGFHGKAGAGPSQPESTGSAWISGGTSPVSEPTAFGNKMGYGVSGMTSPVSEAGTPRSEPAEQDLGTGLASLDSSMTGSSVSEPPSPDSERAGYGSLAQSGSLSGMVQKRQGQQGQQRTGEGVVERGGDIGESIKKLIGAAAGKLSGNFGAAQEAPRMIINGAPGKLCDVKLTSAKPLQGVTRSAGSGISGSYMAENLAEGATRSGTDTGKAVTEGMTTSDESAVKGAAQGGILGSAGDGSVAGTAAESGVKGAAQGGILGSAGDGSVAGTAAESGVKGAAQGGNLGAAMSCFGQGASGDAIDGSKIGVTGATKNGVASADGRGGVTGAAEGGVTSEAQNGIIGAALNCLAGTIEGATQGGVIGGTRLQDESMATGSEIKAMHGESSAGRTSGQVVGGKQQGKEGSAVVQTQASLDASSGATQGAVDGITSSSTLGATLGTASGVVDGTVTPGVEKIAKGGGKTLLMFDLDHCALFGMDGNDLGIALQLEKVSIDRLVTLYEKILNPRLPELIQTLSQQQPGTYEVAIFTRRAHLLRYSSKLRPQGPLELKWDKEWHMANNQIVIPNDVESAEEIMGTYSGEVRLKDAEWLDLHMGFERLLAAREALRRALDLEDSPSVVLTAGSKRVKDTAEKMGYDANQAFLWDDNKELSNEKGVLIVDKFEKMEEKQASELLGFMNEVLPPSRLSAQTINFMLGAKPAEVSLVHDKKENVLKYNVAVGRSAGKFPLPKRRPFNIPRNKPHPRTHGCMPGCGPHDDENQMMSTSQQQVLSSSVVWVRGMVSTLAFLAGVVVQSEALALVGVLTVGASAIAGKLDLSSSSIISGAGNGNGEVAVRAGDSRWGLKAGDRRVFGAEGRLWKPSLSLNAKTKQMLEGILNIGQGKTGSKKQDKAGKKEGAEAAYKGKQGVQSGGVKKMFKAGVSTLVRTKRAKAGGTVGRKRFVGKRLPFEDWIDPWDFEATEFTNPSLFPGNYCCMGEWCTDDATCGIIEAPLMGAVKAARTRFSSVHEGIRGMTELVSEVLREGPREDGMVILG